MLIIKISILLSKMMMNKLDKPSNNLNEKRHKKEKRKRNKSHLQWSPVALPNLMLSASRSYLTQMMASA